MKNFENKVLVLFFTCGVSLQKWFEVGNLGREIKPYNELARRFKKIYFIVFFSLQNRKIQLSIINRFRLHNMLK